VTTADEPSSIVTSSSGERGSSEMGEAGLSPAEVGKEIQEHRRHNDRGESRWVTILEALLLAIVAVMAAWSGYASAKWSTESRLLIADASTARIEASTAAIEADELLILDNEAFDAWFVAYVAGNQEAMDQAERRFRPAFEVAFTAWQAADPADESTPASPTSMPEYEEPERADADELNQKADELHDEGVEAGTTADEYVQTTLYLASVLFLVGISGHFPVRAARLGLVGIGAAITIFAAVQIVQLPAPPG
jgi:hypothetical protein